MTLNLNPTFVGPKENHPLSEADFQRACKLCDLMLHLHATRRNYLSSAGLDPSVYLPGNLWADDFCPENFQKIVRKDYHTLNHLRFLTYNFTGFSLLLMEAVKNPPNLQEVPQDVDKQVRAVAKKALPFVVDFYKRVTPDIPKEYVVVAPRIFGESGWDLGGTIVNLDNWSTQQRINALYCSGIIDFLKKAQEKRGYCRVVEIGAGYGNLAYSLKRMVGDIDYFVVDLPESMVYSSIYLSTVRADENWVVAQPGEQIGTHNVGTSFIPNHLLDEFLPQIGEVDLVINVLSLSEMAENQVRYYGETISQLIGRHGVFFEQNYREPGVHVDVVAVLKEKLGYLRELEETVAPHRGRGDARIWANNYNSIFDIEDQLRGSTYWDRPKTQKSSAFTIPRTELSLVRQGHQRCLEEPV